MHPSCTPSRAGVGSYLNCLASAPADSSPYALPPCSYKWHAGHCCPCTCGSTTRQHLSEVFQRSTLKGSQLESCRRCNCAFHQGAFCVATAFECDEDISCSCSETSARDADALRPRQSATAGIAHITSCRKEVMLLAGCSPSHRTTPAVLGRRLASLYTQRGVRWASDKSPKQAYQHRRPKRPQLSPLSCGANAPL
jgi:hypothetical protein